MSKLEIKLAIGLGCGGAAVPIILYLVPPKSPLLALVLLLALFLLLLYPVWVFCWSEKHRWLRSAAITILAVAVVAFGVYVWPSSDAIAQPSGMEMLTQWVVRCVAYARGLPWFWILISLVTGALATTVIGIPILRRRRKREDKKPRVEILRPIGIGNVGWHRIISGSVFPPDSGVQVLVQFPNDGW